MAEAVSSTFSSKNRLKKSAVDFGQHLPNKREEECDSLTNCILAILLCCVLQKAR